MSDPTQSEKPTITEKEVSWAEAVAAAKARMEHLAKEDADAPTLLQILALPTVPKQTVAGIELEVYNLAHAALMEQLAHPFAVGGPVSNEDVAAAVIIFSSRELLEAMVATAGADKTRQLVREGKDIRRIMVYLTNDKQAEVNAWFRKQFGLARAANGDTGGDTDDGGKK